MKFNRQTAAITVLLTAIAITGVGLALMPKPEEAAGEKARVDATSRTDKTVTRLKSLLRQPDTLTVHSTHTFDSGATAAVVEVHFSSEGSDGALHRSVFRRYYLHNGTAQDGLPTHPDHPDAVIHDPHKLFTIE